nr:MULTISPECIES: type II toxin-antitoxin system RelE/ParE family toxin [Eubacteriales]
MLQYYKTEVGLPYARKFASKILTSVNQLERFPEIGVLKYDTLMGKHGFRALFIDQYACVYKIEGDTVYIYHLADARKNYIYHIFGMEEPDSTT